MGAAVEEAVARGLESAIESSVLEGTTTESESTDVAVAPDVVTPPVVSEVLKDASSLGL